MDKKKYWLLARPVNKKKNIMKKNRKKSKNSKYWKEKKNGKIQISEKSCKSKKLNCPAKKEWEEKRKKLKF